MGVPEITCEGFLNLNTHSMSGELMLFSSSEKGLPVSVLTGALGFATGETWGTVTSAITALYQLHESRVPSP